MMSPRIGFGKNMQNYEQAKNDKGSAHFLHGFLGRVSDWDTLDIDGFKKHCYELFSHYSTIKMNSSSYPANNRYDLQSLGSWINQRAEDTPTLRGLVGYSLGGRIALHSLIQSPKTWHYGILISTHPGLIHPDEREIRLESDRRWARRFEQEEWTSLLEAWNSQPVFNSPGRVPERREDQFSRQALASVMEGCSLGRQRDLRTELAELSVPILWISGEGDAKFRSIADEMAALNDCFESVCIADAGHRIPWDQPERMKQTIEKFVHRQERKII